MAVDVIMPQMGESIFEGTITKWLKKAGDKIERDEPLFEISTDKVDAEIPSPSAGVLKEIKVGEGQTVPIQTVVAVIEAGADGGRHCCCARGCASPSPKLRNPRPLPAAKSAAPAPAAPSRHPRRKPLLRAVKKFAALRSCAKSRAKIILTSPQVPGTGAGGRVSKSDILSAVEGGGAPAAAASPAQLRLPHRRRPVPRAFHQPPAAPPLPRFSKTPSRAKKCTSAITKSSPCP